jgi:hypothetical protein
MHGWFSGLVFNPIAGNFRVSGAPEPAQGEIHARKTSVGLYRFAPKRALMDFLRLRLDWAKIYLYILIERCIERQTKRASPVMAALCALFGQAGVARHERKTEP